MMRTPPIGNGHCYEYDAAHPLFRLRLHHYHIARRLDPSPDGQWIPGKLFLLVECIHTAADDPTFIRWFHAARRPGMHLSANALLRPLHMFSTTDGNAAWVAQLPKNIHKYRPAACGTRWNSDGVFAELFAYACMAAEQAGETLHNVLIHEEAYGVLADTSPSAVPYPRSGLDLLSDMLQANPASAALLPDTHDARTAWQCLAQANDRDPSLQGMPPGRRAAGVRMQMVLHADGRHAPEKAACTLRVQNNIVLLSDLFPSLPRTSLMQVGQDSDRGLILRNLSARAWISSRCNDTAIEPHSVIRPRIGEVITVPLPLHYRLTLRFTRFEPAPGEHSAAPAEEISPVPSACPKCTADYLPAGDPALRRLPLPQLYRAAEAMLREADTRVQSGQMRWIEPDMRIDPVTGCVTIDESPAEDDPCTLGYAPPECADNRPFDESAHSFAAAVWLYRLLVGGYPMEGRRSRAVLQGSPLTEAQLAAEIYGRDALFVFDPADPSNSIDGLPGAFADQLCRWQALPGTLREGWVQTFSRCLHTSQNERWPLSKWADELHTLAEQA